MLRLTEEERIEAEEKGKQEAKLETAMNMLKKNYSLEDILDITGLSAEEINELNIKV